MDWTCWRDPTHATAATIFGWPQCLTCRAAPPYHERPSYLPEDLKLVIYVPTEDPRMRAVIAPRSAIVGLPVGGSGERTSIYYEGWVNGPMQYADRDARGLWEAGVEHAAGRMVTDYPTVAQANVLSRRLKRVGMYHPRTHQIDVADEGALDAWLNQ